MSAEIDLPRKYLCADSVKKGLHCFDWIRMTTVLGIIARSIRQYINMDFLERSSPACPHSEILFLRVKTEGREIKIKIKLSCISGNFFRQRICSLHRLSSG